MINKIKQLRQETSVSLAECKQALEQAKGDIEKAKEVLKKKGKEFAEKKVERETGQGRIVSYIHGNNKIGVLLDLRCETDFVGKSDDFKNLALELCLQITAMEPEKDDDLLSQSWIKDESKTIKDLISEYVAKLGENIKVERFTRYQI